MPIVNLLRVFCLMALACTFVSCSTKAPEPSSPVPAQDQIVEEQTSSLDEPTWIRKTCDSIEVVPWDKLDEEASYPGGNKALMQFLSENFRYPVFDAENGIVGRVTVSFYIEADGSITNIRELRSPSYGMTKEMFRVVELMPNWKPAKKNGMRVRTEYMLPLSAKPL